MRIPNATYREAILFTVAAPVHVAVFVVHVPAPSVARTAPGRTPPVTVVAYDVERTIAVGTVATRKGRKTGTVVS